MDTLRLWVGSLADYNAGTLHGAWIDASSDEDEMTEAVNAILETSPYAKATGLPSEEWLIADSEGTGAEFIGEYSSWHEIAEMVEALEMVTDTYRDEDATEAFIAYCDNVGETPTWDNYSAFMDAFSGVWPSASEWCEQWAIDLGLVENSSQVLFYVDFEAWAEDLSASGYTFLDLPSGNVAVINDG